MQPLWGNWTASDLALVVAGITLAPLTGVYQNEATAANAMRITVLNVAHDGLPNLVMESAETGQLLKSYKQTEQGMIDEQAALTGFRPEEVDTYVAKADRSQFRIRGTQQDAGKPSPSIVKVSGGIGKTFAKPQAVVAHILKEAGQSVFAGASENPCRQLEEMFRSPVIGALDVHLEPVNPGDPNTDYIGHWRSEAAAAAIKQAGSLYFGTPTAWLEIISIDTYPDGDTTTSEQRAAWPLTGVVIDLQSAPGGLDGETASAQLLTEPLFSSSNAGYNSAGIGILPADSSSLIFLLLTVGGSNALTTDFPQIKGKPLPRVGSVKLAPALKQSIAEALPSTLAAKAEALGWPIAVALGLARGGTAEAFAQAYGEVTTALATNSRELAKYIREAEYFAMVQPPPVPLRPAPTAKQPETHQLDLGFSSDEEMDMDPALAAAMAAVVPSAHAARTAGENTAAAGADPATGAGLTAAVGAKAAVAGATDEAAATQGHPPAAMDADIRTEPTPAAMALAAPQKAPRGAEAGAAPEAGPEQQGNKQESDNDSDSKRQKTE
ncbi:hypothetical protein GPECTOR_49g465 [Gonium pectorale]|uniref:Uncharacterized protein n=1 Tax=Gonium pectorale TaxID=33097 RepID=A0A150G7T5_GONPE|nr:hypothetical protein GPECTOR_49g465 [Gonium pectorale]|eukprot:KXZ45881.1 hypothetical protein GPECTOR_49g465 [Gonium pectorale]